MVEKGEASCAITADARRPRPIARPSESRPAAGTIQFGPVA
jgi:hypothetical protein